MDRKLVARIRLLLRKGKYFATSHAIDEMEEDGLFDSDVIAAVETMDVLETQRGDKRGPKQKFEGRSGDRRVGVVGRITGKGRFKIITVYEIHEE
jgi:hypothetical protein